MHAMKKLLTSELLKPVLMRMVRISCSEGEDCRPFPQHGTEDGGSYALIIAGENPLFLHG